MTRTKRDAQGLDSPGTAEASRLQLEDQRTAEVRQFESPTGRCYAGPPCAGRRLWSAVVLTCPWCGTLHVHRVGEAARLLSGRVIRTCPVTGKTYTLNPVQRRKEARRAAAR